MSTETESESCYVIVGTWDLRRCGKRVKADGLCGLHLAAKKKRDHNSELRAVESATRAAHRAKAETASATLLAEFGITARPHRDMNGYDGSIVVDPAELLSVLTRTTA